MFPNPVLVCCPGLSCTSSSSEVQSSALYLCFSTQERVVSTDRGTPGWLEDCLLRGILPSDPG